MMLEETARLSEADALLGRLKFAFGGNGKVEFPSGPGW